MAVKAKKLIQIDFATLCGNSPVFISGPQSAIIKELADHAPGENTFIHSPGNVITFIDLDKTDHHTATVTPLGTGYKGTFALGPINQAADKLSWSFKISDGALDGLQAGQTITQVYRVTVDDGHGHKATTPIVIKLVGTNDAPVYTTPPPTGTIDGGFGNSDLIVQGDIKFKDVDLLDTHTLTFAPQGGGFVGTLTLGAINQATDTFHWNFTVNDQDLFLHFVNTVFQPQTQLYDVTINDGHGGTATQTITIILNPPSEGVGGPSPHGAAAPFHGDFIL